MCFITKLLYWYHNKILYENDWTGSFVCIQTSAPDTTSQTNISFTRNKSGITVLAWMNFLYEKKHTKDKFINKIIFSQEIF